MPKPHFLHVFSTFAPGGPQVRTVTIINSIPELARHSIIAMDGITTAQTRIVPEVDFQILPPPPKAGMAATALRMRNVLRRERPNLVLTYNWGAIDAVLAAAFARICPVVHAEDGFGADEAQALKQRRVLARRALLRTVYVTVVPSRTLERVAREQYRVDSQKLAYIPNGVDALRFHPGHDSLRQQLGIADHEVVFGYVGHLRPEKNVDLLIDSFHLAKLPHSRLILLGDGPERLGIESKIQKYGLADKILLAGIREDTAPWYRAMDVFVLSSSTEQMPVALLEAMASGLPAVCTNVGDCSTLLDARQPPVIVPAGDAAAYANALTVLASDAGLRKSLGALNRQRCERMYTLPQMLARYRSLYQHALTGLSPVPPAA